MEIPDKADLRPFAEIEIFHKKMSINHEHKNWRLQIEVFRCQAQIGNIIASGAGDALVTASRHLISKVQHNLEQEELSTLSEALADRLRHLKIWKNRESYNRDKSKKKGISGATKAKIQLKLTRKQRERKRVNRKLRQALGPQMDLQISELLNSGLSRKELRSQIIDTCIRFGMARQRALVIANKHTRGDAPDWRPISKPIQKERPASGAVKEYTPAQIDQLLGNWKRPSSEGKGRTQQSKFRDAVLKAYSKTCAVTGGTEVRALEAAHIEPYSGPLSDEVSNGICLRADIHKLFDAGLIRFGSDYTVSVNPCVSDDRYRIYHGNKLRLPLREADWPQFK